MDDPPPLDLEVGLTVRGSAAPELVWERYAVPARWPTWSPQIIRVEADAPRIAPGVTGRVHGPAGVRVAFTVTAVDEAARTWAWEVRAGPLRLHLRHGVDAEPPGTATWLSVRGPAPAAVAYLPVAWVALRRLVRA